MISRTLTNNIEHKLNKGKAIIIIGPRQVGKTTLIRHFLNKKKYLFLDGDDPTIRKLLKKANTSSLKRIIGNHQIIFIDEAQRIKEIGLSMKIIVDQFKDVQLWVSGSSSFSLTQQLNEPLTGRKWEYQLYPISWQELENHVGYIQAEQQLEDRLLYGFYPDVINNPGNEIEILKNLVDSYLYKDILAYANIRKSEVLEKLVLALALQIGKEVSYNELSQLIGIDKNTVNKYIDILEKGYVVFKLSTFSRNIRNEIKKNKKIYFYDVGVRNMIAGNFNNIHTRLDKGSLWENFLIAERIKLNSYKLRYAKPYFWKNKQQQEIDYVEDYNGSVYAYEFKWQQKRKVKTPKTFAQHYNTELTIIHRENFRDFVME